jgi:hypothetical protein
VQAPARRARPSAGSPNFLGSLPLVALGILLGTQCIIAAVSAISHQSAFSEYLNQARRCVELGDCPSRGGRAGGLPLFHGASWIRLLAYSLRTGHDLTQVQSIVLGTWILSVPITFWLVRRYLGLRAAVLALGLYFPVILASSDVKTLTYENLVPLTLAVYYGSLCLFIEFRRPAWAAVGSVALAAAVSAELGSIVMVPFHVVVVGVTAPRRMRAVAATILAFAIPYCWDSTDAAREILRQLPTIPFAVCLLISAGALTIAASLFARLLRAARSVRERLRAVMTAALIYVTGTVWLGCLFLLDGWPQPRFFLPAGFALLWLLAERMASALAAILRQVPRRAAGSPAPPLWPAVTIGLCAAVMAAGDIILLSAHGTTQAFTLAEAERLVAKLYGAGYTYPQILASLQGPAADDLMPLLSERDPNMFREPVRLVDPEFSLLLIKAPNTVVPRTRNVVTAVPIDG